MFVVLAPSSLCVWNQMPWSNLRIIVLPQYFCTWSFNDSTGSQNLWSCGSIYMTTFLFLLDFRFNAVEKLSMINLSSYSKKNYALLDLSDSLVTFLGVGEGATFCPFLAYNSFIDTVAWSKKHATKFLVF